MKQRYFVILSLLMILLDFPGICSAQRDTEIYFLLDSNPQEAWAYENGVLKAIFPMLSG